MRRNSILHSEEKGAARWEFWNKLTKAKFWEAFVLLSDKEPVEEHRKTIFKEHLGSNYEHLCVQDKLCTICDNLEEFSYPNCVSISYEPRASDPEKESEILRVWERVKGEMKVFYNRLEIDIKPVPYDEFVELKEFFEIALDLYGKIPPNCRHIGVHNKSELKTVSLPYIPTMLGILHEALRNAHANGITEATDWKGIIGDADTNKILSKTKIARIFEFIRPDEFADGRHGLGKFNKRMKKGTTA